MIIPGFPMPMVMGKAGMPPFTLSGTFATDLEGWTAGGSTPPNRGNSSSYVRTPPGGVLFWGGTSNLSRINSKDVCGGLAITASIWFHQAATSVTAAISYKIGAGSFETLITRSSTSNTFIELTGTFNNPDNEDVTIKIDGNNSYYADDWSISGA